MTWDDVDELERLTMALVVKRRALGGFDVNAGDIQFLSEVTLKLLQHIKSTMRKPKNTPLVGS